MFGLNRRVKNIENKLLVDEVVKEFEIRFQDIKDIKLTTYMSDYRDEVEFNIKQRIEDEEGVFRPTIISTTNKREIYKYMNLLMVGMEIGGENKKPLSKKK